MPYGIKITENAESGGVFYRDKKGKLKEIKEDEISKIIDNY